MFHLRQNFTESKPYHRSAKRTEYKIVWRNMLGIER